MQFAEHGSFRVRVVGQIIFVSVNGPYNEELALRHSAIVHPLFSELSKKGPWIEIVTISGSALFTPGVAEIHSRGVKLAHDFGIAASVFVMPIGLEGRDVSIFVLKEIFEPYSVIRFFSDFNSALSFSEDLLSSLKCDF
jgi:hypothetical protein